MTSGRERPSVSFLVVAYNQERFVRAACEAALAQDYSPLEIVFSDDHSPDRTFEIMCEVAAAYKGPHRVITNRNPRNLGLIEHINAIHRIATGDLIVGSAGDDISLPNRTTEIVRTYRAAAQKPYSIHSSVTKIDATNKDLGPWQPPLRHSPADAAEVIGDLALVIGASHAWCRDTFERFGPIRHRGAYEDLVLVTRSLLLGPVAYIDQPLVRYRVEGGMTASQWQSRPSVQQADAQQTKQLKVAAAVYQQRREDCIKAQRPDLAVRLDELMDGVLLREQLFQSSLRSAFSLAVKKRRTVLFLSVLRKHLSYRFRQLRNRWLGR